MVFAQEKKESREEMGKKEFESRLFDRQKGQIGQKKDSKKKIGGRKPETIFTDDEFMNEKEIYRLNCKRNSNAQLTN